jgi:hypothetical protein
MEALGAIVYPLSLPLLKELSQDREWVPGIVNCTNFQIHRVKVSTQKNVAFEIEAIAKEYVDEYIDYQSKNPEPH